MKIKRCYAQKNIYMYEGLLLLLVPRKVLLPNLNSHTYTVPRNIYCLELDAPRIEHFQPHLLARSSSQQPTGTEILQCMSLLGSGSRNWQGETSVQGPLEHFRLFVVVPLMELAD